MGTPRSPLGHRTLSVPRTDTLFAHVVATHAQAFYDTRATIAAARRRVRLRYPRSNLFRQRKVRIADVLQDVWFGFREGRMSPPLLQSRWWRTRGTASAEMDQGGVLHRPNRAFRALVGLQQTSASRELRGWVPAVLRMDLCSPDGWLAHAGEGTSILVSSRLELEFHAIWDGAGAGRTLLFVRPLPERDADAERLALEASSLGAARQRARAGLLERVQRRTLGPGEHLREAIAGGEWAAIVVGGVVRVYLASVQAEPTAFYGRPGDLVGNHWFPSDESARIGLQAVTPVKLLMLNADNLGRLMTRSVSFSRAVATEGRRQLRHVVEAYASRSGGSLAQRLAREILVLSEILGDAFLPLTEQQLAEGVGSPRESVARAIGDLRKVGSLATTRYGVLILNRAGLRALRDSVA